MIKKKHAQFEKYRKLGRLCDLVDYKKARNEATSVCRAAKTEYERKLVMTFKENPKNFYSYVRKQQGSKVGIPELIKSDGTT